MVFFLIKRVTIIAAIVSEVNTISGVGSFISAASGAKIVQKRAKMLQNPILVVLKTTGKKSMWPM